ncbi:ATP-binding cassette domain-containing protein [Natranaerobius thermophilus]|uniref:ABC transporter related n=1 Tax=Natranaerobius thermophilus (strain ATCC BAA-1301 / DSM 18059 / JW/NM-WN-LF) TaxID=457570 RepID=B2A803_NATTJ|nr:ATP-binding cassette domain-containing protein [Natranaerobius thermophilus]ACB85775.1 ABC transporter related [Natranaerobius thermophilus JW/NM-WN-LF]
MINIKLVKKLPEFQLNVNFQSQSSLIMLEGPSGSGKSTLLNCISGIENPESGVISIDNSTFFNSQTGEYLPPAQRGIGYCFQDFRLFPHKTVKENILYGIKSKASKLRLANSQKNSNQELLDYINRNLEISQSLLERYPSKLSGGEQQRVALARSLMRGTNLLLLDEPFNALDKKLRQQVITFVQDWIKEFGIPTILVSHQNDSRYFQNVTGTLVQGHYHYGKLTWASSDAASCVGDGKSAI